MEFVVLRLTSCQVWQKLQEQVWAKSTVLYRTTTSTERQQYNSCLVNITYCSSRSCTFTCSFFFSFIELLIRSSSSSILCSISWRISSNSCLRVASRTRAYHSTIPHLTWYRCKLAVPKTKYPSLKLQETYLSLTGRAQHHITVLPIEYDSKNDCWNMTFNRC